MAERFSSKRVDWEQVINGVVIMAYSLVALQSICKARRLTLGQLLGTSETPEEVLSQLKASAALIQNGIKSGFLTSPAAPPPPSEPVTVAPAENGTRRATQQAEGTAPSVEESSIPAGRA